MVRDVLKSASFFDRWLNHYNEEIEVRKNRLQAPFATEEYRPQYTYELAWTSILVLLHRYSRGDPVIELTQYLPHLLNYWEEAERIGAKVWTSAQQQSRHAWAVNLDHYIDCFWLVGLALSLEIPDDQWQRLLFLIGNEGEDALLDRVIATRQADRKIGTSLCYPKPYAKLLAALDAPVGTQAKALADFVGCWYTDVGNAAKSGREKQAVPHGAPYWHRYHTLEGGYFGYWCVEAVAAAKAFSLDDGLCIGHPHYPGDLLRPGSVTPADVNRLPSGLVASLSAPPPPPVGIPEQISNWEAFKRVVANKFKP